MSRSPFLPLLSAWMRLHSVCRNGPSVRDRSSYGCFLLVPSFSLGHFSLLDCAHSFLWEIFIPEKYLLFCTSTCFKNSHWVPESFFETLSPRAEPPILQTAWPHCSQMDGIQFGCIKLQMVNLFLAYQPMFLILYWWPFFFIYHSLVLLDCSLFFFSNNWYVYFLA